MSSSQTDQLEVVSGTVVFIDILGFGALTQNAIKPSNPCYHAWGEVGGYNAYILAAKILSTFRQVLTEHREEYSSVDFAQLSDGAFIWGRNTSRVFETSVEVMQALVKEGVLCRAGGATGEFIHVPDTSNSALGKIILGEAVSRAVRIEGQGKGMRLWCDQASFEALNVTRSPLKPALKNLNPMDYNNVYEIVWHMPLRRHFLEMPHEDPIAADNEAKDLLAYYFEHLANFVANPRFIWNEESERGREHIQASIETMLEHLKVYADRYLGDRFYLIDRVRELISRIEMRSWQCRDRLVQDWLDEYCC
jgi:hypothetical protein